LGAAIHVAQILVHNVHALRGKLGFELLGLFQQRLKIVAGQD
jgi:hypothetical protein